MSRVDVRVVRLARETAGTTAELARGAGARRHQDTPNYDLCSTDSTLHPTPTQEPYASSIKGVRAAIENFRLFSS